MRPSVFIYLGYGFLAFICKLYNIMAPSDNTTQTGLVLNVHAFFFSSFFFLLPCFQLTASWWIQMTETHRCHYTTCNCIPQRFMWNGQNVKNFFLWQGLCADSSLSWKWQKGPHYIMFNGCDIMTLCLVTLFFFRLEAVSELVDSQPEATSFPGLGDDWWRSSLYLWPHWHVVMLA